VVFIYGVFTAVSLIVAVSSGWIFGSYTTFIPLGIVYWIALAIATYLWDAVGRGLRSRVRTLPGTAQSSLRIRQAP
jgi:hypothetical protein